MMKLCLISVAIVLLSACGCVRVSNNQPHATTFTVYGVGKVGSHFVIGYAAISEIAIPTNSNCVMSIEKP